MTCFAGGKKRIGKQIYERIRELEDTYIRDFDDCERGSHDNEKLMPYLEPLCGMLGVGKYFAEEQLATDKRKVDLCDSNQDLIAMWQSTQEGSWFPPTTCTREYYEQLKQSFLADEKVSKKTWADRIFIGCVASYGGNCFSGGFRLGYASKSKRDYLEEGEDQALAHPRQDPRR